MAEKLTVFISGTMRDLPTERERVAAIIREMGLEPIWPRSEGPRTAHPATSANGWPAPATSTWVCGDNSQCPKPESP
jgi:hypothetical protein